MAREVRIPLHRSPGCLQTLSEGVEVIHEDAGMGFASGGETFFHSKMDFPSAGSEPAPTPGGQYGRLVHFRHLQHAAVELTGGDFAARWDSQLDVMKSLEPE
jgi:hypothetical protein